ncbi:olfactory receptor 5V1-like [Pleurodeles waltl]|uniref:olfactory receptor 5V1-like n=1 Tax=Pleurodeles waltl TaxID=8319 RepID=UPI003709B5B9
MSADKELLELRQGNKDLISYLLQFNRLVVETAWPEEKRPALFYQGLKEELKDVLAQIDPQPKTCRDLVNLTLKLDHRLSERKGDKKRPDRSTWRQDKYRPSPSSTSSDMVSEPMEIGTLRQPLTKEEKEQRRCKGITMQVTGEMNSSVAEFFIIGFSNLQGLQGLVFLLLLVIYVSTVAANLAIILASNCSHQLQTPMYFFLGNLSFLDICYISVTVPKMMVGIIGEKTITFFGCVFQLYFFVSLEGTEAILLAAMAYDRYMAICNPLRYTTFMTQRVCLQLGAISWTGGSLNAMIHTALTFHLTFCRSNRVNHFFCDIPPLLNLSCTSTWVNEIVLFVVGGVFVGLSPLIFILVSYMYIMTAILKMHSRGGRHKVFSTCASHLTVVILFYGASLFTYVRPSSSYSLDQDRMVSVLYSLLTPLLNPIIYSLRNKDIKCALRKVFGKRRT